VFPYVTTGCKKVMDLKSQKVEVCAWCLSICIW